MFILHTSKAPWFADGAKLTATGETYDLASTQGYQSMETPNGSERPLVQERSLAEYKKEPNFAKEGEVSQPHALQAVRLLEGNVFVGHDDRPERLRRMQ